MLQRQEIRTYLLALGFTSYAANWSFTYADIQVTILDAPRLVASCPRTLVYIAVSSALQLEEQLTSMLGYRRPLPPAH